MAQSGRKIKTRINDKGQKEIFDTFRKKYVRLSPEESVRQQFLHFLVDEKAFPSSLISVEKGLNVNGQAKRFDAVVYNRSGEAFVLIEFKSPKVKINQDVFEQISAYNYILKVDYLIVSNGNESYFCKLNFTDGEIKFLKDIPGFKEL